MRPSRCGITRTPADSPPRRGRLLLVLLLPGLAATGCETTGSPNEDLDTDLLGQWMAVEHTVVNQSNASQSVDLVGDEHWAEMAIFTANGAASSILSIAGTTYTESATWTADGSTLVLDYGTEGSFQATYTLPTPTRLVIELPIGEGWDFDGDQVLEATTETITLVSDDLSPDPAVVGSWSAVSYVYRAVATSSRSVDVIADGGALSLSVAADGGYGYDETWVDGSTDTRTGSYLAIEGLIWYQLAPDNGLADYSFSPQNDTLYVTVWYDGIHDFGQGLEPARSDAAFVAQ